MEAEVTCPHCGEPISLWIDPGNGVTQRYIEDCSVCCRPFEVLAHIEEDEVSVFLQRLDD
jgi:hypothetical protein